jgi:hypothetical protein
VTAPEPVRPGTAENLARLAQLRWQDTPDAYAADEVAVWLLGDVGWHPTPTELWERLQPDCLLLWHIVGNDWDDTDLDDLHPADADRYDRDLGTTDGMVTDARYEATRHRLVADIEGAIWTARYRAHEQRRAEQRRAHEAATDARIHGKALA